MNLVKKGLAILLFSSTLLVASVNTPKIGTVNDDCIVNPLTGEIIMCCVVNPLTGEDICW